jgi:hypothetical protein
VPLRPEADDATKLAENPIFVELKAVAPASSKKKQAAAKKKPNTAPVVEADATPAAAER